MKRIIIIGLGLIGGSLAAACRKKFPRARIIGVSRSRVALQTAGRNGWIHEGYRHAEQVFSGVGARFIAPKGAINGAPTVVILCTPVGTLKDYLLRLDRIVPRGTVVTDAGSVKGFLVRWAERRKWKRIRFVGAHPMAGSHERGIEAAQPGLFKNSFAFVTPGRAVVPLRIVKSFWKKICSRVVVLTPEQHDRITAEISHLPHLAASLLVANAAPRSLRFAASGFLDTTRVAQADPRVWLPIFAGNRREIRRTLKRLESALKRLGKALEKGDRPALRGLLERARVRRRALS